MSRYCINALASQDLREILDRLAENNLEASEQFLREFNRKCQQLVTFPNSGKSYAVIRSGLRDLSLEGYIMSTRSGFDISYQ